MEYEFTGVCRVRLSHIKGQTQSSHVKTDFFLEVSDNLNKKLYLDKEGLPTKEGIKPLTQTFIQGLVGNIHFAHEHGYWDSAEHLRYIFDEIAKGFAAVATTSKGDF